MRIAICIKPVPDLATAYVSKSRGELVEDSKRVPNPADLNAVELALSLRQAGDEVVVFAVGPDSSADVLRPILAAGADRAFLIDDPAAQGGDALADAKALAAAIRHAGDFDLILCGARSVVHEAGQAGPRVAQALGVPHASRVTSAAVAERRIAVTRAGALGEGTLELPALVTVEPGSNSPRLPTAMAAMKAAKKPIEHLSLEQLGLPAEEVGEPGAAVRLRVMQVPEG
jgi:electron transfer flavoprotein beta subunit